MTQTTFAAPDFARVAGCSARYARWWLRRHVANYPEAHVRMDGGQFLIALARYKEYRGALRAARQQWQRGAAQKRTRNAASKPRTSSGSLRKTVLEAYARTGNASQAARETGCPPRTARRWISAQGGDHARTKTRS